MRSTANVNEGARLMAICNACRYCEGHCAVFQAMELRLEFNSDNLDYLANLCHNCGSCYHHCQYAPPHEFKLNVPGVFADLRKESYGQYAWPRPMGKLYNKNGLWVSIIASVVIALALALTAIVSGADFWGVHDQEFYGVLSHNAMVSVFGTVGLFVLLALGLSMRNFWQAMNLPAPWDLDWRSVRTGVKNALSLKYLDGGNGQGCAYPTEAPSHIRRVFHQLTFWGFMLCFASTSTATVMHYGLDLPAPYGYVSLPKVFGILGGLGLILGPIGLFWIKGKADKNTRGEQNQGMDITFLWLLLATSVTGLGLMLLADTQWVGLTLSTHLGVVMTLFLTMPYGKFIHGFFRLIALVAFAMEQEEHQARVGVEQIPIKNVG